MIQKITTIPNPPAKGVDYDLGDGYYARVVYRVLSNTGGTMMVEMQAFQVDASGNFIAAPTGEPSRTPSTTTEIHLSGCTGSMPTCTIRAGWVVNVPPEGVNYNEDNLPSNCAVGTGAPTGTGAVGDNYYDTVSGVTWKWHPGALEGPVYDKAVEMRTIIVNSANLIDLSL